MNFGSQKSQADLFDFGGLLSKNKMPSPPRFMTRPTSKIKRASTAVRYKTTTPAQVKNGSRPQTGQSFSATVAARQSQTSLLTKYDRKSS